jgi:signal transduction histidine kinase
MCELRAAAVERASITALRPVAQTPDTPSRFARYVRNRTESALHRAYMPRMLHEFLSANRADLIDRCRVKTTQRRTPKAAEVQLEHGISFFLDQLIRTLQVEQTDAPMESRKVSGPSGGGPFVSEISATAALHGRELLRGGYTVDQVVHDYGDLCQAVTDLAFERNVPITVDEFRTLNRCLDNGIADAVMEFASQRDSVMAADTAKALNERLGSFVHELRDLAHTATLAVTAIKTGKVGITGATGAVLDRCLTGLRDLLDRSLAEVRVTAGPVQRVCLADFVAEIKTSASLEANARQCMFTVGDIEEGLAIDVDRDMLLSAVGNLLQNAFKFTRPRSEVSLNVAAQNNRIMIDVADHCGGLPPDADKEMFLPFVQRSKDRSGVGLGLAICQRSVEANNGVLRVRNVPGTGCVFTIDLPRQSARTG